MKPLKNGLTNWPRVIGRSTFNTRSPSILRIGNSISPPTFSIRLSINGMEKIARKLVRTQMKSERGTFPRAIAVMIVPDETVTGPVAIIQTPITNS